MVRIWSVPPAGKSLCTPPGGGAEPNIEASQGQLARGQAGWRSELPSGPAWSPRLNHGFSALGPQPKGPNNEFDRIYSEKHQFF